MSNEVIDRPARVPPPLPAGRINLTGELEVLGPHAESVLQVLGEIVRTNLRSLPRFVARNGPWMLPVAVLWILLSSAPALTVMQLPSPVRALFSAAVFLTAAYNGFVAKAAYLGIVSNVVLPMVRDSRRLGLGSALNGRLLKYARTFKILENAYRRLRANAMRTFLTWLGVGFAVANFLSRNNKIDKYLVCFMGAVGILEAMARGLSDPTVRVMRALLHDASRLTGGGANRLVSVEEVLVSMAGAAAGLAGSITFAFLNMTNSFWDPTGYIAGAVCIGAAMALKPRLGRSADEKG